MKYDSESRIRPAHIWVTGFQQRYKVNLLIKIVFFSKGAEMISYLHAKSNKKPL